MPATFQIEKSIPTPTTRTGTKYPFASMDVGDSFYAGPRDMEGARVSSYAYANRHNVKFRTGREGDGLRVWRIA